MNPQRKGVVPPEHAERLVAVAGLVAAAKAERDATIVAALKAGGSSREVAKLVGLSSAVVTRIGHKGGWPTDEQRAAWDEERRPSREFRDAMQRYWDEFGGPKD